MQTDWSAQADALERLIWELDGEHLRSLGVLIVDGYRRNGWPLPAVLAELSDETLALAVQKDFLRELAFEEWMVNRYEKWLLRYFYSKTRDWHLAEDLTQRIFIKFLTKDKLARYDPTRRFCAMLRTVAFNLMVQDLRYRKRRAGPRPTEFDPADQGPGPVDEVCLREKEGLLEEALAQLPADQATILRATLQGQDAETIARNLGFTKPQVFQRLFKARRRVEKLLGLAPDTADPRSQEPTHGPAH